LNTEYSGAGTIRETPDLVKAKLSAGGKREEKNEILRSQAVDAASASDAEMGP
jgi:hypothetical protein